SVYDGYNYAYDTATVTVNFINTPPTIVLPAGGFEFDMNGSLTVDFSQYVDDADNDPLTLEYAGNTNVLVSIDELSVTFTATGNWFGTENLSFTASDGTDQSTDTAYITVNLNYLDIPQVTSITHTGSGTSIEWNAVTNANVYHIYRALEPFGSYEYLGSTSSLGYEDNQMFDMAFYQVRAVYEEPVAR
ncbi:MAG: Ig-like domain-containing protein, partial [Candidatus Syntrophosphaera sp.]